MRFLRRLFHYYRFEDLPPETQEVILDTEERRRTGYYDDILHKDVSETMDAVEEVKAAQRGDIELDRDDRPLYISKNRIERGDLTYDLLQTSQFKKDIKRLEKRKYDLSELNKVILILGNGGTLPPKYHNHPLEGNYAGTMECHIRPDWLLIYSIDHEKLILYEIRTGSHSDLF